MVPGDMEIDGNKTADQFSQAKVLEQTQQGPSLPLAHPHRLPAGDAGG